MHVSSSIVESCACNRYMYNKKIVILLCCFLASIEGMMGQQLDQNIYEGDTLEQVEMTWEEASIMVNQFLDAKALRHNLVVDKMAKDPRMISYVEDFKTRNGIDALTFSYIEGNAFWERVFNKKDKSQWNEAQGDLVKGRIVFQRVGSETSDGYDVFLEVQAGNSKVYDMFKMTEEDFQVIVAENEEIYGITGNYYSDPGEAHEGVVKALIAALTQIEGGLGAVNSSEDINQVEIIQEYGGETHTIFGIQKELVNEALKRFEVVTQIIIEDKSSSDLFSGCLPENEARLKEVLIKIEEYLDDPEVLLNLVHEDDDSKERIDLLARQLNGKWPPYSSEMLEEDWDSLLEMFCLYLLPEEEQQMQYFLPLRVTVNNDYCLVNKEITTFISDDTILIQKSIVGVGLKVMDSLDQELMLTETNFKGIEGTTWSPGFIIDIEDLSIDFVKTFQILIEGLDTLKFAVVKEEINEDLMGSELQAFNDDAQDGIDDGESWNPNGYACNNAVRAFLYYHKADAVLFPITHPDYPSSSYGSGLEGPDDPTVLKGEISWEGTADKMWDDFDGDGNDLTGTFSEISKNSTETWNTYFNRLQKAANQGTVIIGVVHSDNRTASRGHVVALMPESLCSGDQTKANDVGDNEEDNVGRPCALEAGSNEKEITWFKQNSSELDNYKWFKYDD